MHLFIRLTLAVAAALVAFFLLIVLVKVVLISAIIAGLVLAGMFVFNFVRSFARIRHSELAARQ